MLPPLAAHFTFLFDDPLTVAVNCTVWPAATLATVGEIAMRTSGSEPQHARTMASSGTTNRGWHVCGMVRPPGCRCDHPRVKSWIARMQRARWRRKPANCAEVGGCNFLRQARSRAAAHQIDQAIEHALAVGAQPVVLELVGDPRPQPAARRRRVLGGRPPDTEIRDGD